MQDARGNEDSSPTRSFFASTVSIEAQQLGTSADKRVEDLQNQLNFLDAELVRYRALLEKERLKTATALNEQQLLADRRADEQLREHRRELQSLRDAHRIQLDTQQAEYERQLSTIASSNAELIEAERARHAQVLRNERTRKEDAVSSAQAQARDEAVDEHNRLVKELSSELDQAMTTIVRLQAQLEQTDERERVAAIAVQHAELAAANTSGRLDEAAARHSQDRARLEAERDDVVRRLDVERKRSSATIAELLEQSAKIAADVDAARAEAEAARASVDEATRAHAAATRAAGAAHQEQLVRSVAEERARAKADYRTLIMAADERATRALARETELETLITELRKQLES